MASVRLAGVSKTFGQNLVLRDIDLTIADREFMVLVGPSGCGKSTLLRLIAGLETLSSGAIYLGDRQIDHLPPKSRDMAMVFQSYALYPHMSVYNNIAFGLRRQQGENIWTQQFNQKSKQAIAQRVEQVAKSLQIYNLLQRKPSELSGGQKQRVALGRAIARNPQVFLMDEPLSNLDAQLRGETRSQLVQLQNELQTTTIYVTHDQTEAMTMGTRIVVLKAGKIQQVDTPINIYRQPANVFVAGFIGSPQMNFLPVFAQNNAQNHILVSQYLNIDLSWQSSHQIPAEHPLILGFRPEQIQPSTSAAAHLSGRVKLIESLGSETNLIIDINGLIINAKVSADLTFSIGELTHWQLDLQKFHIFDGESETRLPSLG
jgi:multiple sugar transport system ATP-binding protein